MKQDIRAWILPGLAFLTACIVLIAIAGALLFGEWPTLWFYPGAAVVMAGVMLAIGAAGKANASQKSDVASGERGLLVPSPGTPGEG